MTTIYNLESGVVPGVRVDGISIGQSIDDIGLDAGLIQDANGQKFAYLLDGAIFIAFQNDGIVFQISAANGYKGAAQGMYSVGSPIVQLIDDADWFFSELEDGFVNKEIPGVVVEVDLEDADTDEILSNRAVSIVKYSTRW